MYEVFIENKLLLISKSFKKDYDLRFVSIHKDDIEFSKNFRTDIFNRLKKNNLYIESSKPKKVFDYLFKQHELIIAAGGIASGKSMFAAMALGADGVQVGSRFVASSEASSHLNFKNEVVRSEQGSTILTLKEITPVRMIKNSFYNKLKEIYDRGGSVDELKKMLGRGRAKKGMFEGDLIEGELEIGQVASQIDKIISAESIIKEFIKDYNLVFKELKKIT